jgi:adenylylsulfate kinase-like enzyme
MPEKIDFSEDPESVEFKNVVVEVRGRPGTGKSTIAQLINEALLSAGFMVRLVDDDNVESDPEKLQRKMASLRERIGVSIITVSIPSGSVMAV